jgi:hypothetical protein
VHGGIGLSRGTWVTVSGDIKLLRTFFDSLGLELPAPNTVVTDYLQVPLSLSLLLPLGPHAVVQLGGTPTSSPWPRMSPTSTSA